MRVRDRTQQFMDETEDRPRGRPSETPPTPGETHDVKSPEAGLPQAGSVIVARVLEEQVGRQTHLVRIHDMAATEYVDAAKDEIRLLPTFQTTGHTAGRVLDALREHASRPIATVRFREVGTVQHIGDAVATLTGLRSASTDELVEFPTGTQGMILNLDRDHIDVILLGPEEGIQGGDLVTAMNRRLQVPVGPALTGRVIDPLGAPLDDRGPIITATSAYLEREAPAIVERTPVNVPLQTGLKIIDALVPIGRGQRELILGDRQTGKTTLAIDTILNQASTGVACVYVAIGQKKSSTAAIIDTLQQHDATAYTTVVVASPDGPPALRYLAPYAGAAIAESFMDEGRDVLVVYDDLTKHADAYRELSLLLRRPPGREAYPGDMFYAHSRLLERAAKLRDADGGGSITALPIAEMQRGNIAAYIPTNLISICDGQIVLDTDLFNRGLRPAVDVGRSVSRVAGTAQTPAMRAVAGRLRLELSQFEEVAHFARFGTEVDELTWRQIQRGERIRMALTQAQHEPRPVAAQVILLMAVAAGHVDDLPVDQMADFEAALTSRFESEHPSLFQEINLTGTLPEGVRAAVLESSAAVRAGPTRARAGLRTRSQGEGDTPSTEGQG